MRMHIYRPGVAEPEIRDVDVPEKQSERWNAVKRQVVEILLEGWEGTVEPERVAVLFNGERCDMLVDETSALDGQAPNDAATEIYWNASRARGETPAPDWPRIHGTAVLFEGRIWF